ncbi:gluconate 2-dehydrogenase subunit 3 family protein [Flavobacterium circumlabens]|uniref:Gluconate 2-dehydrogenase subunit 3 family protein n=1 Tax=Flavobacterium circumlabens TaxID=2133765 RepID=A0A4Y7UEF3_9FLAO|nr:gluconate 2-dehydrogenase subunit 3 family protein [Flavobacterium circumlabens]TCN59541.1 gluconate 2-dehydrogenase subunit 3-like protein [Flavobacterium circumlabens]TEB44833.1 gluconate 2-dehydrogenase subunit 3 family protein [Flavobacterium circumlabens]
MKRREAIKNLMLFTGGTILFSAGLLAGCNSPAGRTFISKQDIYFLDEIGETIIPTTARCGGAKAAKIGLYMKMMVNKCITNEERLIFLEGLKKIEDAAIEKYRVEFLSMNSDQKKELFLNIQLEAEKYKKDNKSKPSAPVHYFQLLKDLIVKGYFTSEIGATEARRYEAIPTRYIGCINYKKGDRVWATS